MRVQIGFGEKTNLELTCGHADKLFEKCFATSDVLNATKIFFQQQKKGIPYSKREIEDNCK
jgi:hypothetical protein